MSSPRAPPVSLEGIGGIGDRLQLPQHELRHDQRPIQEPRFAHVGDPAVDDRARVQNLVLARWTRVAKQASQPRRVEPLAAPHTES